MYLMDGEFPHVNWRTEKHFLTKLEFLLPYTNHSLITADMKILKSKSMKIMRPGVVGGAGEHFIILLFS